MKSEEVEIVRRELDSLRGRREKIWPSSVKNVVSGLITNFENMRDFLSRKERGITGDDEIVADILARKTNARVG